MTCVLPPETYKTTGFLHFVATLPISMCATQWLTATNGRFHKRLNILAQTAHDRRGPPIPTNKKQDFLHELI
jgi:hypothetical protein